jgi:DNA-binding XRE family transcriptional regulator
MLHRSHPLFSTESESQHVCHDDYRSRFCICQSRMAQQVSTTRKTFANIVSGEFTPVLAKHTKSFNLVDTLSVGVDRIQRNFEPLQRQVELWRKTQITDDTAKLEGFLSQLPA